LFVNIAQVFFALSGNSENFFYSLSHKDLSAFWPPPKTRFFVNIAQVGALYRGARSDKAASDFASLRWTGREKGEQVNR